MNTVDRRSNHILLLYCLNACSSNDHNLKSIITQLQIFGNEFNDSKLYFTKQHMVFSFSTNLRQFACHRNI